jgi:hypothetical protein
MDRQQVSVKSIRHALAGVPCHLDGIFIRVSLGHQGTHTIKITKKALREIIKGSCGSDWFEGRFCGERGGRDLYLGEA